MTPKRILAAHDGSKDADQAFETAVDLAAVCGARLQVVSVASPPEPPTRVETEAAIEAATRHYEEVFAGLRRRAAEEFEHGDVLHNLSRKAGEGE